jgi:hypothetical protein
MSRPFRGAARRFQGGTAAVELAVIAPVLMLVLAFTVFFGRVFWHYTAAHKAAHDAGRYLSSVPQIEMKTPARAANVVLVARTIAEQEVAGLSPGPYAPVITIACDTITCDGFGIPTNINVTVRLAMFDEMLYNWTNEILGDTPLVLTAAVSMRYVGK